MNNCVSTCPVLRSGPIPVRRLKLTIINQDTYNDRGYIFYVSLHSLEFSCRGLHMQGRASGESSETRTADAYVPESNA